LLEHIAPDMVGQQSPVEVGVFLGAGEYIILPGPLLIPVVDLVCILLTIKNTNNPIAISANNTTTPIAIFFLLCSSIIYSMIRKKNEK
jgi:hypothetical protein